MDPRDLRPVAVNRPASAPGGADTGSPVPGAADDSALSSSAAAKLKLLCSFGGRIAPRPGDGALRYVGGHTRLISASRGVSFPELMRKVAAADGGDGAGVAVKYQLPGEDLDALISISSEEDFENMLEEYDKLAASCPDGAAKLRVFLFPAGEGASDGGSGSFRLGSDDRGQQRYLDALNCPVSAGGSGGSILPKTGSTSANSSTRNSDGVPGTEAPESASCEGISLANFSAIPAVLSDEQVQAAGGTAMAQQIAFSRYVERAAMPIPAHNPQLVTGYTNGPQAAAFVDPSMLIGGGHGHGGMVAHAGPGYVVTAAQETNLVRLDQPPIMAHYISQGYVDPHTQHGQYINSPQLGMYGTGQSVNLVPVHVNSYMQGVAVANPAPVTTASAPKPALVSIDPNSDGSYTGRPVQPPRDPNQKVLQPLSQLPPLPPNLQPHYGDMLGAQVPAVRFDDCALCQKALAHVHSDNMISAHGNAAAGDSGSTAIFYSLNPDNIVNQHGSNATGVTSGENTAEQRVESVIAAGQLETQSFVRQPVVQHADSSNVPTYDTSMLKGTYVGNPQLCRADEPPRPLPQQQQQWQSMHPSQFQAIGVALRDHVGANDARVQVAQLGPIAPPQPIYQSNYPANYNSVIGSRIAEQPITQVERVPTNLPQASGHPGFAANDKFPKLIEQMPPAAYGAAGVSNVYRNTGQQLSAAVNHTPILNPGVVPPSGANDRYVVQPIYDVQSSVYGADTMCVSADKKNDPSRTQPAGMLNQVVSGTPSGNGPFPGNNVGCSSVPVETAEDPLPSDSFFSNQDPWKAVAIANMIPPKPTKITPKEAAVTKDQFLESHPPALKGSNVVALLEEGHLYYTDANKGSIPEVLPVTKGSGESVTHQLQAVAEDVAASVLQPSSAQLNVALVPSESNQVPLSRKAGFLNEKNTELVRPVLEQKREDMNPPQDRINQGVHMKDEIEHLQIIKNSDLEELRELGSGTFGTVYYGKWKGTDVAIKRINDRCFAGKPSEQDRLRTDFWNEASKLASLHHPNVVAFYGIVLDGPGGSFATVTEYMANGSLRQALQKNDKLCERRKRMLIAMDVAFGMEYLHEKNIVHFDLKSDNLLVNLRDPQRPICKVGDLGLSKVKCQTLISGGVRGTLPWMAPELLNGRNSLVSEKVDVFSFGIVMWELLTGEEPYADLHYGTIIGGIVNNTLRPLVPDTCEPEWRALMEQCWSAEPAERPSFTEIVKRLRSMVAPPPQLPQN